MQLTTHRLLAAMVVMAVTAGCSKPLAQAQSDAAKIIYTGGAYSG